MLLYKLWSTLRGPVRHRVKTFVQHSPYLLLMVFPGYRILETLEESSRRTRVLLSIYREAALKRNTPIIVYHMAKVGSTSIYDSLLEHGVACAFHTNIMERNNEYLMVPKGMPAHGNTALARKLQRREIGPTLYRKVIQQHHPVKVITLVRDPIARNISFLFAFLQSYPNHPPFDPRMSMEELTETFYQYFQHSSALTWFDLELKQTLGIDVYAYPFPKEQGYLVIKAGNIDLLILKNEREDTVKEQVIADFLGLHDFHLIRSNVTAGRFQGGYTYKEFVQYVRLPQSYIEAMYRSPYMQHFYSDAEIERMRARWSRNVP